MMPTYSNGYVPENLLITFASGWDDLGYWEHQWPAHTLALHNALVARAAARRAAAGLAPYPLRLQSGWCAYRPRHWQQVYRDLLRNGAATPGTSSHGGTFEGSQTMAGDYAWQAVYRDCGGREAFFADCRAVGLLPGMIMASRGYPDEDWHVIDPNPWAGVPAGFDSTAFEEDDMFTDEDRNRQKNIENLLAVQNAGYGYPQVIAQDTGDIRSRIRGPQSQPFDQLQLIVSLQQQTLSAIASGQGVDFPAMFAEMTADLKAQFDTAQAEQLAEIRAALADVDGVSEADLDAALANLKITRAG